MIKKTSFRITPLLVLTLFALTSFIYHDFNIRMILGYGLLFVAAILFIILSRGRLYLTKTKIIAFILAVSSVILILLPHSRKESGTFGVIFALVTAMLYILIITPDRHDMERMMKLLIIASVVMSVYAIVVDLFPVTYSKFIKNILSAEAQRKIELNFKYKYGVAVGGESILPDYYAFFGIAIALNTILLERDTILNKKRWLILLIICFAVIILQNRKSELVTTVLVIGYLFLSNTNKTTRWRKQKTVILMLLILIAAVIAFLIMMRSGLLARYRRFIDDLIANISGTKHTDITSGRLKLWARAWSLFKENPVFGIGWGNFKLHVTDTYNVFAEGQLTNVHNNYLQILCETGIVGFLLFVVPMFGILFRTIRCVNTLRRKTAEIQIRITASVSLSYQLFFLIISFIDPVWYKMFTWLFYGISVAILSFCEHEAYSRMPSKEACLNATDF